jgi:UDP-N-acetylmuramoylalanine--D-glutamate ligase
VLILGLAREGESLARYFRAQGARVIVTDQAPAERLRERSDRLGSAVELHLGGDFPDLVERADRFFVSPGVPLENPVYEAARARGLRIESMTTLFFDLCPAPIVGITGSRGKTTTTSLIGHILRAAGANAVVGGNIGDPMLDLLPRIEPTTHVVLELSSFQLETLERSPHLALVTNISPDHLDRHGTMAAYIAAKQRIVRYQNADDTAILNAGDPEAAAFEAVTAAGIRWFGWSLDDRDGMTVRDGRVVRRRGRVITPILDVSGIPLLGAHNLENVLAALAVIDALGIDLESAAGAVHTFSPPPHRLQIVAERDGVRYIDDSIATSPARAGVALEAIEGPIILIAGGRDKNLPWDNLARLIRQRARALLLIGEAAGQIEMAVRTGLNGAGTLRAGAIRRCASLEDAVQTAHELARPGDAVLLSPGCTSFDMFSNYEKRGEAFGRAVETLDAV